MPIVYDTYTGTNGTALNGRLPDIGPACTAAASFDIQSNKARQTGGSGVEVLEYQGSVANTTITATVQWTAGAVYGVGMVCRYVDASNYWLSAVDPNQGGLIIQEVTAGVFTTRALTAAANISLNTDYTATFVINGTSITATFGATSANYTSSQHQTATRHGFFAYAPYGGSYTFDTFSVLGGGNLIGGSLVNRTILLNKGRVQ